MGYISIAKALRRVWRWFWGLVWRFSELEEIPLGRVAPWVFQQMIGAKKARKLENEESEVHDG